MPDMEFFNPQSAIRNPRLGVGKEFEMDIAAKLITGIYLCLVGYVSAIMIWNLIRAKSWEKEILYLIVLVPFLLRLFWLK
jgi:hypothetical protein